MRILGYVDDETYRRDINCIRNLREGRHSLAAPIFHGKKGELYQRDQGCGAPGDGRAKVA